MNVADGLKRLKRSGPEMMNGSSGSSGEGNGSAVPAPGALLVALPLALVIGAAVVTLRRRGGPDTVAEQAQATGTGVLSQAQAKVAQARARGSGVKAQAQAKGSDVMAQVKGTVGKVRPGRRKPRNLVRYYGIGLLITLIERDVTRKIVLTTLKWMQKRA